MRMSATQHTWRNVKLIWKEFYQMVCEVSTFHIYIIMDSSLVDKFFSRSNFILLSLLWSGRWSESLHIKVTALKPTEFIPDLLYKVFTDSCLHYYLGYIMLSSSIDLRAQCKWMHILNLKRWNQMDKFSKIWNQLRFKNIFCHKMPEIELNQTKFKKKNCETTGNLYILVGQNLPVKFWESIKHFQYIYMPYTCYYKVYDKTSHALDSSLSKKFFGYFLAIYPRAWVGKLFSQKAKFSTCVTLKAAVKVSLPCNVYTCVLKFACGPLWYK